MAKERWFNKHCEICGEFMFRTKSPKDVKHYQLEKCVVSMAKQIQQLREDQKTYVPPSLGGPLC